MKISLDQAITSTGACAFTRQGEITKTFVPKRGLVHFEKRKNLTKQILNWLDELEFHFMEESVTAVSLEEFVPILREGRIQAMLKLHDFTGYLRRALEDWGHGRENFQVLSTGKGNATKAAAQEVARSHGLVSANEHEADAFYLGLIAGFKDET